MLNLSHDKWERMLSGADAGADSKSCDLSEPIRLGSGYGSGY